MPLEIRELLIKATVNNGAGTPTGGNSTGGNTNEIMLNEVVGKVLEIIKEKAER